MCVIFFVTNSDSADDSNFLWFWWVVQECDDIDYHLLEASIWINNVVADIKVSCSPTLHFIYIYIYNVYVNQAFVI